MELNACNTIPQEPFINTLAFILKSAKEMAYD